MDQIVVLGVAAVAVALVPTALWLYGEANGATGARRLGAVLMVFGWCGVTTGGSVAAMIGSHFNFNTRWTGTICEFGLAVDDQLAAGRVDHVRKELQRFRDGQLHGTYESGLFLRNLHEATAAIRSGGAER